MNTKRGPKPHQIMTLQNLLPTRQARAIQCVEVANAARRVMGLPEYEVVLGVVQVTHAKRPGFGTAAERRLARDMLLVCMERL